MSDLSAESSLVAGLKDGDPNAWRNLYALQGARIYRLVAGMVGWNDAKDLTQEVFLQAYRKIEGFRHRSAIGTWLHRIAINKCLEWLRKRRNDPVSAAGPLREAMLIDTASAKNNHLEELDLLQKALEGVEPGPRAVLLLHVQGRSYREICGITKIRSKGTVHSLLTKARKQLHQSLVRLGCGA